MATAVHLAFSLPFSYIVPDMTLNISSPSANTMIVIVPPSIVRYKVFARRGWT